MTGNTTNKFLIQPSNNSFVDIWDTPVNSNTGIIDTAFGGLTNLNATGLSGNVSLTLTQYQPPNIVITGVPTGNLSYQLPGNVGGFWSVQNGATGNATVGVSAVGNGTSVTITQGTRTAVISDGFGNVTRWDNSPASPGGSSGQVQYNSGGVLAGSPNLTFTGGNVLGTGVLQLNGSSSGFIQIVPAATSTPTTWILPSADGTIGQVLSTNGAGVLGWITAAGAGVTTFNGRSNAVTLASSDVSGALGYVPGYIGLPSTSRANSYTSVLADSGTDQYFTATGKIWTIDGTLAYGSGTLLSATCPSGVTLSVALNTGSLTFVPSGATGGRTVTGPGFIFARLTPGGWLTWGLGVS